MKEVAVEVIAKRPEQVVTIREEDIARTAAERMCENKIGSLAVVDEDGALRGIVTERDLINRVLSANTNPSKTLVKDIMTFDVIAAPSGTTMHELREIMTKHAVRHVPILRDGILAGVVSAREVMEHQRDEFGKARDVTVFAMAKVAESRDPETGRHLERVRDYTHVLAKTLEADDEFSDQIGSTFLRLIRMSCTLHDIGKVAIPDCVLLKPGRLDDKEFELMKTHCTRGAEMLEATLSLYPEANFLNMARDIAAYHHERFDGSGYPYGLAGDDIPLPVRIFSLADVYDALITKRVYKEAFAPSIAADVVFQGEGSQFDPALVRAFVQCQQQLLEIKEIHDDDETARIDL